MAIVPFALPAPSQLPSLDYSSDRPDVGIGLEPQTTNLFTMGARMEYNTHNHDLNADRTHPMCTAAGITCPSQLHLLLR